MKRVLLLLAGVALLLFGSAVAANAEPVERTVDEVSAMAAPAGCDLGNVCFWVNSGYRDGPGQLAGTNNDWRVFAHGSCPGDTWNNCASSVYNHGRSCWAYLWDGFNRTLGTLGNIGLNREVGISNLADWGFNDAASSNSWSNCV
ncbi:peptidase inhibitor family I36 protein [Saccharothrix syringae]|uniref:Peptidase inhibitor family I36 n=1 Tax=Saccharothrix syringae TaxID=103733 RepID=A0A5Q0H1I5_SACSY|nr:peptidase inhibitor family I36 protein [Saccharothrix syringae]QFZ20127.1 hypothetical protein EKG83_24330 [Saccharothrix syringae]